MSTKQQTLDGDTTDEPAVAYWCDRCEQPHLVADFDAHGHRDHLYEAPEVAESGVEPLALRGNEDESNELSCEEDDEPEKVGEMFNITLSYSADYNFRVPAWSESQAKDRAKDLMHSAQASDMIHVHTGVDSRKGIYSDDEKVPDDYDPYGSEMLWEVYGKTSEEDEFGRVPNLPYGGKR